MAAKFREPGSAATQDFSFWSSTSGTVTSATDQVHTGSRSIKCSTGSPSTVAFVTRSAILADAGRRISVWYRVDSTVGSAASPIIVQKSDGSTVVCSLAFDTSRHIGASATGIATSFGTTVVPLNTWVRLSLSYYITSPTVFTIRVYLNGVLEASLVNAGTLTNTASDTLSLRANAALPINSNAWFSDIYVDDGASSSSQPDTGDVRVTYKRPNANGTTNNFTTQIGSGGSGYGTGHSPQVNEQPLSQTNGWSVAAVAQTTEEYNIEGWVVGDVNLSGTTLVDVAGWVFAKSLLSETGQLIVNGNNSNISLTSTPTMFVASAPTATYPGGGGADIGLLTSATVTTVSLYECGVLISYTIGGFIAASPLIKRQAVPRSANW